MFCKKCGAKIEENVSFCSACGEPLNVQVVSQKRELNITQLVWSIISLVCLCFPLGIASLIFTLMAQDAKTDEEEEKCLKHAKTCNIIATILAAVLVAFCIGIAFLPLIFVGMLA